MTLILALGNSDQMIQLSDRRLTVNGMVADDESNKAGVLITDDARLAFGFTGLARIGAFATREWLTSALGQHAGPDFTAHKILEYLKERATRDFQTLSALRHIPQAQKPLGVIFSGYTYRRSPPAAVYAILQNYSYSKRGAGPDVWDHFQCTYFSGQQPLEDGQDISLVQRIGFWPAMNEQDVATLRPFLIHRKPARAILGKAIEVFHAIADRPEARGVIGKQLTSITLARDTAVPATSDYHSSVSTHSSYMPDLLFVTSRSRSVVTNISVAPADPANTPPSNFPRVGRNAPCPCRSGKKYKRCHGRRRPGL